MNRNDILWKAILEDIFDDFLRFFLLNADAIFDMSRGFEFLDKELEQIFPPDGDEFKPKHVDKLVKVFTQAGDEEWILVHVEVQGHTDKEFAKRMFTYFSRIFDRYEKPITAFAILSDDSPSFRPTLFERSFLGTHLLYTFNSYKIADQNPDELEASLNPFASVVLTVLLALQKQRLNETALLDLKVDLTRRLLARPFSKDKIRALMTFLKQYVRFEKPETTVIFEEQYEQLTKQRKTMGIEEFVIYQAKKEGFNQGREEGLEKGIEQGIEKGIEKGIEQGLEQGIEKGIERGLEQGIEQGIEQGRRDRERLFIRNLIKGSTFADEQIAHFAGVEVGLVAQIRAELAG